MSATRFRRFDSPLLILCGVFITVAAALILVTNAAAASPVQITSATVNADRSVSVNWNVPAGPYQGVLVINPTPTTDYTGELPAGSDTIDVDLLAQGWTNYKTLPLSMTITQPTTIYVQVQLVDPYDTGGCQQGSLLVNCDSQVVALTVNPICTQALVKAGYYSKKLVRRGHWLRRNGHYLRRHGHRVWVKPAYRRVHHPPVYQTQCH